MVEINNLTTASINEQFLRKVAEAVLAGEKKKGIDLSIAFIGQERMRKINKKYGKKNLAIKETKVSSSPTTSIGGVRKSKNSFDFANAWAGDEAKASSSPFANAWAGDEANASSSPFANAWAGDEAKASSSPFANAWVTDVLAFPESKVIFEKFKVGPIQEAKSLGEIIICPREVNKNAKKYKTTQEVELSRVLIHGILHLLGYDHEKSEAAAERMREKEEYYFSKFYVKN